MVPDEGKSKIIASQGRTEVSIPTDPDSAIKLDGSDGPDVQVRLPAEVDLGSGQVTQDGTVDYQAEGGTATAAAVQILEDGSVRLLTVSADASGTDEFTYSFGDDVSSSVSDDGTVELIRDTGDAAFTVGSVGKAWAVDASGAPVETEYRVDGEQLVQTIDPGDAAVYPIVADPVVTRARWHTTIYFNRKETAKLRDGATGLAAVSVALPAPLARILAVTIGFDAAYISFVYDNDKCIKAVLPPRDRAAVWLPYGGDEARGYCKKKKK